MRRASLVTALASVLLLLSAGPAAAAPVPMKVIDPPGVQLQPFRNDQWVAFTSNAPATPNHLDAFVMDPVTHDRTKLNAAGQAVAGGFDPTANRVIYQQSGPGSSAIFSYNLTSGARKKVAGVNSPADDTDPRILRDVHLVPSAIPEERQGLRRRVPVHAGWRAGQAHRELPRGRGS